ncbi:NLR family, CARD domain containing 5 isoform X2 [Mugil cephalus]|uniref:NLR family, CARD domain containing 5 isoform X2 n=1 Tax=Mugil cephalus TaxID=48193 RepID=UPI001FB7C5AA|nr:NLR family, CARD domain containing 5 isoform X2 [Mugil cephalus]
MDEEVKPDDENVNYVLAQESKELFHILAKQPPSVIMQLYRMMPGTAGGQNQPSSPGPPVLKDCIEAMLEYFKMASAAECCSFLQSVCLMCENIPMHLDSRLMSVAGRVITDRAPPPGTEAVSLRNTDVCGENSGPDVTDHVPSSPLSDQHPVKRPRLDHWEQYITAATSLLQRRWKRLTERLVKEVQLENVWVSLRTANRGRDRPDQTPGSADRGSRTPEPDGDFGCLESRLTLETFLQGCAGKVTALVGQAGSGKTLLMSCLGQQWANGLGPVPSSYLFVLLEFRQLNLLSRPLSLSELLFQHYLPPKGGDNAKRAIVDYLLSNPEQSCWVLDGYDEFHGKLSRQEMTGPLDPKTPMPVAELISALLNRRILPGSTVLVTCRPRDAVDLGGVSDKVGQLLGWDQYDIKEYVDNFFGVKDPSAHRDLGAWAADLLLSSRHLLAMSSIPALCNICCICLEHLLVEGTDAERPKTDGGGRAQRQEPGGERGRPESVVTKGENGRAPLASTQVPTTITQVYLTMLGAFVSRDSSQGGSGARPQASIPPQSSVTTLDTLSQYGSELCELSRLAWRGLEESKILFVEEDIPPDVLKFSLRAGFFSQVEVRRLDGAVVNAYCFIHLTVQEFLAALIIMTTNDVSDAHLKKRFSLKTRWTTRTDQKTVFTDSLYLYVCGLASSHCTSALVQLSKAFGGVKGIKSWVQQRQALVLKLLKTLCNSNNLTGPKILQLCHSVQESQDQQLARQVVGARPTLELRNIWLSPSDIDALAFVVNSAGDIGVTLDFGACSMELDCLDVLSRCQHVHCLSFHSRKYGDKFAEKLSSVLPEFPTLRKLEFCGASVTATGAASLASGLENCPNITEINLTDNNLKDEGVQHIAEIFNKLPRLVSVKLGRNNTSLNAVDSLIEKMPSCLNIQDVHADGMKEVTVTFSQNSDVKSHKLKPKPTISLLNQNWCKSEMQKLAKTLARCPALSVLDLSGGQWDEDTLRTLTQFVPKFNVSEQITVNNSCSSVESVVVLTTLLSDRTPASELHIRLQSPVQVSIVFPGETGKPATEIPKKLSLSCCKLLPADMERVWKSLGTSSGLTVLDLSSNCLGNKGLKKLLEVLTHFRNLQEINASNNNINMEGVVMLASALCSHNNLTQIHISNGGKDELILRFSSEKSTSEKVQKTFRINNSSLLPSDITTVCRRLVKCRSQLELELSHSSFKDKTIENLLTVLPKMLSLQKLDVSHSITSATDALTLVRCLTDNKQVTSVELSPQSESFITFDEVKAEQVSCRLTHFCLNGDDVERLIEILQRGPRLSDLDLSSNHLGDEGVKRLVDSLPRLKISSYVNLSDNRLTQQGLLSVASTLCTCANVCGVEASLGEEKRSLIWFSQNGGGEKTLSVRESSLQPEHVVRLAEITSSCHTLAKLELKNNLLQSEWIENFVKLLNSTRRGCTISIEESWITAEEAVHLVHRCLSHSSNIQTIRVHQTTLNLSLKPTEPTSARGDNPDLAQSMATEKIGLVDCALDGYHLASLRSIIQSCPSLTELDLSNNNLGEEGAEFLCSILPSLPNLTSLSIGAKEPVAAVVESFTQACVQSANIQDLNLSGHKFGDAATQSLTTLFPRLRSLNLSHCVWTRTGGLQLAQALGRCVSLEDLCLDCVHLHEEGRPCLLEALRNMTSIRRLKLNKITTEMGQPGQSSVLDLLAALEGLGHIEEIELDGWRMADAGVEQLTGLLPVWKELKKISLSKNLISDHSGEKLLIALKSCSRLEELHLSSNLLGDLTAASMALVLPSLTRLSVLDISDNRIGDSGSRSLSRAIMYMKNLKKIHLTSVGTSELCAVAASLAHCPLVNDVSLSWNNCGDEVAQELSRVLPFCLKLTRIDLECNSVSVLGAEALVRALRSCPALQLIRLWKNKVSQSDALRLMSSDRRLNFAST